LPGKGRRRVTVRLSEEQLEFLRKLKEAGRFETTSDAIRFCINLALSTMNMIFNLGEDEVKKVLEEAYAKTKRL
jgi:Arc/MetJ-type ribon-helix-helix transcriptional regulator